MAGDQVVALMLGVYLLLIQDPRLPTSNDGGGQWGSVGLACLESAPPLGWSELSLEEAPNAG